MDPSRRPRPVPRILHIRNVPDKEAPDLPPPPIPPTRGSILPLAKWYRGGCWTDPSPRRPLGPNFYKCETLQEQLLNIFTPMWDATMYPRAHPQLAQLLAHVAAFNVISDEARRPPRCP